MRLIRLAVLHRCLLALLVCELLDTNSITGDAFVGQYSSSAAQRARLFRANAKYSSFVLGLLLGRQLTLLLSQAMDGVVGR